MRRPAPAARDSERTMTDMLKETESTAQALTLRLQLGTGSPTDFERLFPRGSPEPRRHALLVFPSPNARPRAVPPRRLGVRGQGRWLPIRLCLATRSASCAESGRSTRRG